MLVLLTLEKLHQLVREVHQVLHDLDLRATKVNFRCGRLLVQRIVDVHRLLRSTDCLINNCRLIDAHSLCSQVLRVTTFLFLLLVVAYKLISVMSIFHFLLLFG